MILKIHNERTFYISPGRGWCFIWHNSVWVLGVVQTLFMTLAGVLAAAHVGIPAWAYAAVLFFSAAAHNLQIYLKGHPAPELTPDITNVPTLRAPAG